MLLFAFLMVGCGPESVQVTEDPLAAHSCAYEADQASTARILDCGTETETCFQGCDGLECMDNCRAELEVCLAQSGELLDEALEGCSADETESGK
jgi:hypothetical protein